MIISDVIKDKNKIMNQIIAIPDVYTVINNTDITTAEAMRDKNIFSRMKIPNTTLTVKNYICFDYSSKTYSTDVVFKTVYIGVACICYGSDANIKTPYGNRHDLLAGIIIDAFNWSNFLGFQLELVSDVESVLEKDYYCRTLQFKNMTTNNLKNKLARNEI
jgi:hypothetical protein